MRTDNEDTCYPVLPAPSSLDQLLYQDRKQELDKRAMAEWRKQSKLQNPRCPRCRFGLPDWPSRFCRGCGDGA